MSQQEQIKKFESAKVRTVWDDEKEEWYISIVDTCAILNETDYDTARKYWKVLKGRLIKEGFESVTNCYQLKLVSQKDGKRYKTDVATPQELFRIIQSIPSKKAEPFKQWMAQVAAERLHQMQDPELDINQAIEDYRRLGYNEEWITRRIKTIEIRKGITDEWKRGGVKENEQFAFLTDLMSDMERTHHQGIQATQRPQEAEPARQYVKHGTSSQRPCRGIRHPTLQRTQSTRNA